MLTQDSEQPFCVASTLSVAPFMLDMGMMAEDEGDAQPVIGLGDSLRELKTLPAAVRDEMRYAIYLAQHGDKHVSAKPLKGLGSRQRLKQAVEISKREE